MPELLIGARIAIENLSKPWVEEQKADVSMTLPILVKLLGLQVDVDRRKSPVNIREDRSQRRSHYLSPLGIFVFMFPY